MSFWSAGPCGNTNAFAGIVAGLSIGLAASLVESPGYSPIGLHWAYGQRLDDGSRMSGDVQVRFCERLGVKFPRATHPNLYVRSERAGHRVMASVVRFIEKQLRLKVNQAKSAVARPEERHFVGFSLRRNPEDGTSEVFLSKRSKDRIDAKIRELTPRAWGQSLSGCIATLNTYLRGWLNFFGTSCTDAVVRTLHTLDAHIRRRLRALLLRQWKRRRFIVRRLIRMGARPRTAWRVVYEGRKALWALSHCSPVDHALNKAYFAKRGLF